MRADALIVGGGPAGTAVALALRRYSGLEAVVLDRDDYSAPRIGETIGPGVKPLIAYLGIERVFEAAGHRPAYASAAAWGDDRVFTRDFLLTGRGDGWHLDRNRFDRSLADAAQDAGAAMLKGVRIAELYRDEGWWKVRAVKGQCTPIDIEARFLVEASGRSAVLARRLGAVPQRSDRLAGVIGFVDFDPPWLEPSFILVEAVPEGWWYSVPLPDNRLTVVFMSDADLIQVLGAQTLGGWLRVLARAPQTRARVVGGRRPAGLLVRRANSQVLQLPGGDGWLACGDAAASHDPLSSMGIGHAIASGAHTARAVEAALRGDFVPHADYIRSVGEQFASYLETRLRIYRLERRWPHEPFWARRNGAGWKQGSSNTPESRQIPSTLHGRWAWR